MSCGGCAEKVARGVIGLVKAAAGIDRADAKTIQTRRDICRGCEHATRSERFKKSGGLTNLSRCGKCDCLLVAKTVIEGEKCPEAKW